MARILVVDDDDDLREVLVELLKGAGYEVEPCASGREAVRRVGEATFDLVVLDRVMPNTDGIQTLGELRSIGFRGRVVMLTAFASVPNAVETLKRGADDYLAKPFRPADLIATVARHLEEAKVARDPGGVDVDAALATLASPIRRRVLQMLRTGGAMRLMELVRELGFSDHTKVLFHLRSLRDSELISQDDQKRYCLTPKGESVCACLETLRAHAL